MITTWSEGRPDDFMPEAILVRVASQIHRHPWWRARSRLVKEILRRFGITPPAHVLDAGCGWGVTLTELESAGYHVTGLDISRRALERLERPGRQLIQADLTKQVPPLRGTSSEFDAVLALDVIEHLDDDRAATAELGRLVRPGGLLVVSVPALPELFSKFDRVQGHRRRYGPEDLRRALDSCGMVIQQLFWWGGWLVPLLRMQRLHSTSLAGLTPTEVYLRHLVLPPWPIPWFFKLAFAWEQPRAIRGRLRRGTSLVAVARRPDEGTHDARGLE
jgi:SAM-dependent methyltransferase